MSESTKNEPEMIAIKSERFGDITVAADTVIDFPGGLIGFPRYTKFVMSELTPPFARLHSVEDGNLAFIVMDGSQFVDKFAFPPPFGDKEVDLKEDDELAILILVTALPNATTTANLKAPLFVNVRNRKGVQIIYDNPEYPLRFHLWGKGDPTGQTAQANPAAASVLAKEEPKK